MTKRAPAASEPGPRRTQEERRTATIRRLLEAATDTLIDVGYAEASVQAICARAGVSQGALFRHFPTREALMVAVGEYVGQTTLARYRSEFESLRGGEAPAILAMRLVRMHTRSRLNQALYELLIAARTRTTLREALAPTYQAYIEGIVELARETQPELVAGLGDAFPLLVRTIIAIFDGESMQRFVLDEPSLDEARLNAMAALYTYLAPNLAPDK